MELLRPTYVHIHLDRLIKNYRFLQSLKNEQDFICPMIKANAYGHGDIAVSKALGSVGCDYFGVSSVEEALHLRISHVEEEILVFGFHGKEAVDQIIQNNLTAVVSNFDQLSDLCRQVKDSVSVHLKFDTGMHRLGFQSHEVQGVLNVLNKNPLINVKGVCTHLHSGENSHLDGESSSIQFRDFEKIAKQFPEAIVHAYNSPAIASLQQSNEKLKWGFRPGLLVYGIDPMENQNIKPLISPVMEFKSKIVATQRVKSGGVVSYGGTWQATKDSTIGIVPAGYADGVCRSLSNSGEFLVCGQKVPIRGRVCMDYTMVDLTDLNMAPEKLLNQEVVLWGEQQGEEITLSDVSKSCGRVHYEILTCISERVPRYYGATE